MKLPNIVRDVFTLLGGNVLAQAIALIAYFILTRIYSPDDFGLFSIFYSYIELLVIASTCKYELAVVVADTDREAAAVARFALRTNTAACLLLLTAALALWLTGLLPGNFSQLGWIVLLIPPMVFFCGTSRIYSFLYNRFHRYTQIALSDNINAAAAALLKIALGTLLRLRPSGLPMGAVLGQAAANIGYRLNLRHLALPPTTATDHIAAARRHRNFPLFVASKDFLNTLSANLPFLWLAMYFDHAEVGLLGLALTFTRQPVLLLCSAFERVLYARGADAIRNRQPLQPTVLRFVAILNAVAIPIGILAWWFAEPLFTFCFGSRWQGCTAYVQALLPWVWLTLTANSLMFVANIFSTQRTEFFFHLAQLLLRIIALAVGIAAADFLLSIRLFAAVSALTSLALLIWYLWQVASYEKMLRRTR